MQNRNVQADYDSLNFEEKGEFINIICELNSTFFYSKINPVSRLKTITGLNQEDRLFEIRDKEVLKATSTSTQLECLDYATADLINNRDTLLEILENFAVHYSIRHIKKIPIQFRTDIEVIQTLTKSNPSKIRDVLNIFIGEDNSDFKAKIKENDFVVKLVNAYFNNVLNNEEYVKQQYAYYDFLWCFTSETLEGIENKILFGPEPTVEREKLKSKIYTKTTQKRDEIIKYRKSN